LEYDLEVEHCAFELHPGVPLEGERIPWPPERMAAARARFQEVAAAEGLAYGERTHWYNSAPAHEAALWADQQGNGEDFRRALYRAYFVNDLNVGSHEVLALVAEQVNLDATDLRAALTENRFREQVAQQFKYARETGITGVPAYVAGGYLMVGAQPYEVFRHLIQAAQSEHSSSAAGA
jgi:predicted DsbA family dithiol-disulfide isomerase